jgi:hypothetical protein
MLLALQLHLGVQVPPPSDLPLIVGKSFCGGAASVSALILAAHAAGRAANTSQLDPFRFNPTRAVVDGCAAAIAAPYLLWRRFACWTWPLVEPMLRSLFKALESLFENAREHPLSTASCVIGANVAILSLISSADEFFGALADDGSSVVATLYRGWLAVGMLGEPGAGGGEGSTDVTFAVLLLAASQVGTYIWVRNSTQVLRWVWTGPTVGSNSGVDAETLNSIAATMESPKQCPRCSYGR